MSYEVKVDGVDELLQKLNPGVLEPIIGQGLAEVGNIAKPEIESRTPIFRGVLARSVTVKMDQGHLVPEYVKIGPTAPHTHLVESGVKPHFPPWLVSQGKGARRLRAWVLKTLQPDTIAAEMKASELDRMTFLVARAISRRGVRPRYFIRDAFRATESQIEDVVDGMVARLEGEWDKIGGPVG